jgi:protein SCO1/2
VKGISIWVFVAAVVLIPVGVFGVVKWYEHTYTRLPVLGGEGHTIADFSLPNQHGSTTTLKDWKGKIVVADFFFTHCPVVCPKMTRSLKRVQQLYMNDKDLLIASFTVDPERDSVAQLAKYAAKMDITKNWTLLTGPKKDLYLLARKSFLITATDGDGGPDDFIHSELLILVDPEQRIRGYYNGTIPAEVDDLVRDIQRLKEEYDK